MGLRGRTVEQTRRCGTAAFHGVQFTAGQVSCFGTMFTDGEVTRDGVEFRAGRHPSQARTGSIPRQKKGDYPAARLHLASAGLLVVEP